MTRAMQRVNLFLYEKYQEKVPGLSATLYLRIFGLAVTPNPKVIFIILIITLNLHDPIVLAAIPEPIALDAGLAARSCYKKCDN